MSYFEVGRLLVWPAIAVCYWALLRAIWRECKTDRRSNSLAMDIILLVGGGPILWLIGRNVAGYLELEYWTLKPVQHDSLSAPQLVPAVS
jgi:hypothetical protein